MKSKTDDIKKWLKKKKCGLYNTFAI